MVGQTVTTIKMRHKDGKPRKKLTRLKATANGQPVDLRKLAARRRLVVRR